SFPMALVERAKEVRDALVAAGVQRAVAQIGKKATNASLVNAVREGKGLRSVARAALSGARTQLFEQGNTKAVNTIDATFASTRESGADAAKLGEQLTTLADVLA